MRGWVGDSPVQHVSFANPLLFVFSAFSMLCLARWWRVRHPS